MLKAMKTILIHSTFVGGHQLEYLHHLYMGAISLTHNNYIFVVPKKFFIDGKSLSWPESSNIQMVTTTYSEKGGMLSKSYRLCKDLAQYINMYKASEVILIELMSYLPFLPFQISSKVKVSGIIYRIYLYDWKSESRLKRLLEIFKYVLFSRFKVFDRIFILNDSASSAYLNKLYHTSCFCYLTDPVASLPDYKGKNIRDELCIDQGKTIYLHPGGMLPYKGTIEILKALTLLNEQQLDQMAIIFSGRITPSIRKEFNYYLEELKDKVQIVLIEGYLPFERLADLFITSDYVLIPYKVKSQSSGIVGHAAYYKKPVIVAKGGVIGKLVRKWQLGYLLNAPTPFYISDFLCHPQTSDYKENNYKEDHSIDNFINTILKNEEH